MAEVRHCKRCRYSGKSGPTCTCDYCAHRIGGDLHLWQKVAAEVCYNAGEKLPELANGSITDDEFIELIGSSGFSVEPHVVRNLRPQLIAFASSHYNNVDNPPLCNCPGLEKHGLLDAPCSNEGPIFEGD